MPLSYSQRCGRLLNLQGENSIIRLFNDEGGIIYCSACEDMKVVSLFDKQSPMSADRERYAECLSGSIQHHHRE